jgi:acylphosphatase
MGKRANKRLSICVSGRVQGVGFRFFVRSKAQQYGLSGWVRNCSNGDVALEAQGEPGPLERFREDVRQGPPMGEVDAMHVAEIEPEPSEYFFEIRH